jgi:hypothetical protein
MRRLSAEHRQRILTIIHLLEHYELALRGLDAITEDLDDQGAIASAYGYVSRAAGVLRARFVR